LHYCNLEKYSTCTITWSFEVYHKYEFTTVIVSNFIEAFSITTLMVWCAGWFHWAASSCPVCAGAVYNFRICIISLAGQ